MPEMTPAQRAAEKILTRVGLLSKDRVKRFAAIIDAELAPEPADWMQEAAEEIAGALDAAIAEMCGVPIEELQNDIGKLMRKHITAILARHRDAEVERLRGALKAESVCQTCSGEKRISMECAYCLGGAPPPCKCADEKEFDCPECDGTGISLKTEAARAAIVDSPVPACGIDGRNLRAVAHNLLVRWDALRNGGDIRNWGGDRWHKFYEKVDDLRAALSSAPAPTRPDASELVEALKEYEAAATLPNYGDYSGFGHATFTYEKSYGGGECSKHGRYYGSCASCRFDFERFQRQKDAEARRKRDSALDIAGEKARAALANWEASR